MKKLINASDAVVRESPERVWRPRTATGSGSRSSRRIDAPVQGKVGIVSGGTPVTSPARGFVCRMLDAASLRGHLRAASRGSGQVIADVGPKIRWLERFVTDDKTYCMYVPAGEDIILEHARCAGIPAKSDLEGRHVVDPSWRE